MPNGIGGYSVATLNPVIGWDNYFRSGNVERKFNQPDSYVWSRLIQRVEKWAHKRFQEDHR